MKINKGVALLSGLPDVQHDLGLVALRAATACCHCVLRVPAQASLRAH
eukprot:CAMPEP_0177469804 /NCGR_PEP_ID=MMETSP0369-20130122/19850_1 /TAXON_ID=447022 ORGANISM="Scrippsiella hangoei-like, Strain SHHI-4" /NCGR_SAMPLE_ID=MMETSP0369 /ASSEMBLY_ACC=CAM_ASM_000364 /LENGTH=47 /DNA_ID= /DNA_START= /DNA_END= /DNA_ORIENTATION=